MRERARRLGMRVRARAPKAVRKTYRLAKALTPVETPRRLDPALLDACRVCPSRDDLVTLLPARGRVAEVGTLRGDFARVIVAASQPSELHLIDIDLRPLIRDGLDGPEVHAHQGISAQVLAEFPDDYFDWIYIDGDHSYSGCLADARAAAAKIRPGGYLVFNDFAHLDPYLGRYGVQRAVTDFANENAWPLAFFAFEPHGLYDVALRRPPSVGSLA